MKYWTIVRTLESGGSISVGLNEEGFPFYSERKEDCVKFVDKRDAENYLHYCRMKLSKIAGQEDLKVVESE